MTAIVESSEIQPAVAVEILVPGLNIVLAQPRSGGAVFPDSVDAFHGTTRRLAMQQDGQTRTVDVRIPAGVDDGSRLRVGGEGEGGWNGGPPGDLYVFLSVGNHPKFTRRDYDIHSEHVISFTQAALGAEGKIDTIDGKETLKIPNGTQPGQVFRLRGKGVQFLDGSGRGDHYVHVTVKIPASLSEDQRRLLQELATLEGEHPPERGVLDKVKDFFSG